MEEDSASRCAYGKGGRLRRSGDERAAIGVLIGLAIIAGILLTILLRPLGPIGWLAELLIVAIFIAQKGLADHVGAVASGLRDGGIDGGRKAVAMIVGRDPQTLVEAGVARAAIESLSENASDGVIAPALWYAAFGLPGLFAYKLVNTADSMIGNFSDRHREFGRTAAKIDDAMNWIPARVTGMLTTLAAWTLFGRNEARRSFNVMMRDARLHRSPNSGWPETAFAGALGIALAGPRSYASGAVNEPMQNAAGRRDIGVPDIELALDLFWRLCVVFAWLVALLLVLCAVA
jgi:adenosylcobinamide-phosphate synthase